MGPSEDNANAVTPEQPARHPIRLFIVFIIGIQILVSLISYPFLPALVPSHWDAAGHVNGYMPKLLHAVFEPALSIGLYALLRLLVAAGPKLGRANQQTTVEFVDRAAAAMVLLFLAIQLITIATALGRPVDASFVIGLFLSLLFIFIGNYMGKVRRNFWAGIRTPWTLASDTVWERTHRLGGWLFVVVGVLGIIMDFIPFLRLWRIVGLILLISLGLTVYSYVIYHRLETAGKEPLSPPFKDES